MKSPARILIFALIGLGTFLVAFGLGRLVGTEPDEPHMSHSASPSATAGDAAYSLDWRSGAELEPGRSTLEFAVVDGDDEPVRDFDVEHEKELHLIVVAQDDPRIYQHLHPTLAGDEWSVPVTLAPGDYRVYADTVPAGAEKQVLTQDLTVSGTPAKAALPAPYAETTVDGYDVKLTTDGKMFRFAVERDAKGVELEPYLGAGGHLVVIRETTLDYLHAHPMEAEGNAVGFHVAFDEPGTYVLNFDFKVDGKVHTASFVQEFGDGHDMDDMGDTGDMEMEGHDSH